MPLMQFLVVVIPKRRLCRLSTFFYLCVCIYFLLECFVYSLKLVFNYILESEYLLFTFINYMTGSVSGQDEPNLAL